MTGRLYIDGSDAYQQYGVYVTEGGWNGLVSMPPMKAVESNDWQEEDGVETDLSAPRLDTREVSVTLAFRDADGLTRLVELLSGGSYHDFDCASIGRKYRLRMTQVPNLDIARTLGTATLKLADDFPMQDYTYEPPEGGVPACGDYMIDGVPASDYGLLVLKGTLAEIMRPAAVKPNMLRNISTLPGAIYDGKTVTFKTKDVRLKCLMRAETLAGLWKNYDALLHNLIQPEERLLTVEELAQDFPFYYKSCQVTEFCPDGRPWLALTLTLAFTGLFRIESDTVLAAEDGTIITDEDGGNAFDMEADAESGQQNTIQT